MKSKLIVCVVVAMLAVLSGCTPDKVEIELYTSDIQKASTEGVMEVSLTATFSMMGEDESGDLPKASVVAKRYLGKNAEFKMSEGDFGAVMVVKCNVPMGTADALETYLATKHRPCALIIDGHVIKLVETEYLKRLNQDLGEINMMLDVDLTAGSTIIRFVGDMAEAPEIMAFAVFVDEKPELVFTKKIKRRTSICIDYKGGDASVYSEISPQFNIKF